MVSQSWYGKQLRQLMSACFFSLQVRILGQFGQGVMRVSRSDLWSILGSPNEEAKLICNSLKGPRSKRVKGDCVAEQ